MMRYYDPTTGTESLNETGTSIEDMPEASRAWFTSDPIPDGKQWETDPTGNFPVLVDIPPPTPEELIEIDRSWAQSELARTDFAVLPDTRYIDPELAAIKSYRHALRNPQRSSDGWTRPTLSVEID